MSVTPGTVFADCDVVTRLRTSRTRAALLGFMMLLTTDVVRAQCGAPASSCRQCHEIDAKSVPARTEPWHADHAFGDFCVDCHGGLSTSRLESEAHANLVDPLDATGARCVACHSDGVARVRNYSEHGRERTGAVGVSSAPKARPPAPPSSPTSSVGTHDELAGVLVAFLAAVGGAYVVSNERRRRRRAAPSAVSSRSSRASGEWSPYVCGALLGVLVAISMALFGHRLSGGGAYQQIAAPAGRLIAPGSVYWNHVLKGGARWELSAFAGALLGSFTAARVSRRFRLRTMPDSQWADVFGTSVTKRWLVGFVGAALTEFASGVAGGCTASLAISGGAALAPGAFAFMAGMFAGGAPAALFVYRKRGRP